MGSLCRQGPVALAPQRSVAHAHVVTYPVVVPVAAAAVWLCLGALTVMGLRHRGSATPSVTVLRPAVPPGEAQVDYGYSSANIKTGSRTIF